MLSARTLAGTAVLLVAASAAAAGDPAATSPNPAAALCVKNGATREIETQPNGSQRGICVFPNGTRIDEWAYFRNKHRTH